MEPDFFEEVSTFVGWLGRFAPFAPAFRALGYVNIADYVIIIIWDKICQKWDEICFNVKKWDEICVGRNLCGTKSVWDEICVGRNMSKFHVGRNLFGTKSVTPVKTPNNVQNLARSQTECNHSLGKFHQGKSGQRSINNYCCRIV